MAKKNFRGKLNSKPKFAKRVTNKDGVRVWAMDDGTEYKTKAEYFSKHEE